MGRNKFNLSIIAAMIMVCVVFQTMVHAEIVDRIVAVVNNDIITLSELNTALNPYMDKIEEAGYSKEKKDRLLFKIRKDMLGRLVDEKLTDQEVRRLGIKVSDKEVDSAIENVKSSQLMTQEELEKALKKDGMSFEDYRNKIRHEIMRPKLINYSVKSKIIITDEDVKAYYETNHDQFAGEKKVQISNILIICDPNSSYENREEKRGLIDGIKKKLDLGGNFSELARAYSQAPNAADGGALGVFAPTTLADQLREVILSLKEGEYTDVQETSQGFQIFALDKLMISPGKKLEDVSDMITKKVYEERVEKRFKSWVDSLRENSHIKTML